VDDVKAGPTSPSSISRAQPPGCGLGRPPGASRQRGRLAGEPEVVARHLQGRVVRPEDRQAEGKAPVPGGERSLEQTLISERGWGTSE
jgi:hypothetical protein